MAETTTLSGFPAGLAVDGYKWYWEEYDKLDKVYPKVFTVTPCKTLYTKSTSGIGTGLLVEKPEGQKHAKKSPVEGYTVYGRNFAWSKQVGITKELHDDFQKLGNFLKSMMPQWAEDAVETMETFYANIFNYGGYTAGHSYFNATIPGIIDDPSGNFLYDSKPLFNLSGNARASKGGGTYYNGLALAASKSNLQTAWNLMSVTNNRREDDTRIRIQPKYFLASPSLKFTVDELIKSPDDPTTANRAINVMRDLVEPVYWHYLDSATQWTLIASNVKGLKALMRVNPEFDMWEDKETKGYFMSIFMRFGVEITNWRGLVSSNFSTA